MLNKTDDQILVYIIYPTFDVRFVLFPGVTLSIFSKHVCKDYIALNVMSTCSNAIQWSILFALEYVHSLIPASIATYILIPIFAEDKLWLHTFYNDIS